jgi:hypothetical protein
MRRTVQLLFAAFILFGSALAFAGPAAAGPAQPYHLGNCYDDGVGYKFCYNEKGVYTSNQTPSGNEMGKSSGIYDFTYTY